MTCLIRHSACAHSLRPENSSAAKVMLLAPGAAVAGIELAGFGEETGAVGLQRVHISRALPVRSSCIIPWQSA